MSVEVGLRFGAILGLRVNGLNLVDWAGKLVLG